MYIEIGQRKYKEECNMCGTILYQNERFIVATNGEKDIKMCLLCARKTSFTVARGSNKRAGKELASKIESLLQEIRELNKNDKE